MRLLFLTGLWISYAVWADSPVDILDAPLVEFMANKEEWQGLPQALLDARLFSGAQAASVNTLLLYSDQSVRKEASQVLIRLMDAGYDYDPIKVLARSDIQWLDQGPEKFSRGGALAKPLQNLLEQINFYKFWFYYKKKNFKWASFYKDIFLDSNDVKLIFFDAIQLYKQEKWTLVEEKIKTILENIKKSPPNTYNVFFIKRVMRTLARSYFEQKRYEAAWSIYEAYLLRTEIQHPNDWLEAAWCHFYLKNYPKALGLLVNLEAGSSLQLNSLEPFLLTSLIYEKMCAIEQSKNLIKTFNKKYGNVLKGIRLGRPLKKYSVLLKLDVPENKNVRSWIELEKNLKKEIPYLKDLSKDYEAAAKTFYKYYRSLLNSLINAYKDRAQEIAAEALILMQENLKFSRFNVEKEQFNPDRIFLSMNADENMLDEGSDEENFENNLLWVQKTDFWLDERMLLQADLKDQCLE